MSEELWVVQRFGNRNPLSGDAFQLIEQEIDIFDVGAITIIADGFRRRNLDILLSTFRAE